MSPVSNTRVLFNAYPKDYPIPGETLVVDSSKTIDIDNTPLNGGVLLKLLAISIDPYQRGKMNKASSYRTSYQLGEPITNQGVGKVIRSENSDLEPGQIIYALYPFQEYVIWGELPSYYKVINNSANIPLHTYVGMAGMPGKTAYYGWRQHFEEKAKSGGTIFISTAAGPVGSFLVQLAKKAGLKVIGATGSDEKVEFLKSIGTDVAINYKKDDLPAILAKEGPIDMYWDHVGGDQLDAALENISQYGIIVICGLIAGYNSQHPAIKNFANVLYKQLSVQGYNVWRYDPQYADEFYEKVPQMIKNGDIQLREHIYRGLVEAPQAIVDVQKGNNNGKAIVVLSEE